GKRPLLSKGNPREILKDLLEVREPVYALADLHVTSKGGTKAEMRDHVLAGLDQFLKEEKKHDQ
ncbi:MAG: shikimate kinase, partial [Pseudomonadota bacterium]